MTEGDWLACEDPAALLAYLGGRASPRKFRLYAVACCRRVWGRLYDGRTRHLVEVAERYADGEATDEELRAAARANQDTDPSALRWAAANAAEASDAGHAARAAFWVNHALTKSGLGVATYREGNVWQCRLLHDVFGNPFRPLAFDPRWRDDSVVSQARKVYESRLFTELPVLANALEEAGCTEEHILRHCRMPGLHVRGCHILDAVLGRE